MIIDFLVSFTLIMTVLVFGAFAALYCERSGLINIAINGQMIFGALIFSILGFYLNPQATNNGMQFVYILITMIAGGLLSFLFSYVTVTLKANQIIVGTAINLLVLGIATFFVNLPSVQGHIFFTHFKSLVIPNTSHILNVYFIIGVVLAIATFVFFRYTKHGIYFVSCGENHHAMDVAGINVIRTRYITSFIAGVLTAFGGCVYTFTISNTFKGDVQGIGFVALAIMIFGQWRVIFTFLGCVIFAALYSFTDYMPYLNNIPTAISKNSELFRMLPFVLTLLVMIIFYKYNNQPLHDGKPFIRGER